MKEYKISQDKTLATNVIALTKKFVTQFVRAAETLKTDALKKHAIQFVFKNRFLIFLECIFLHYFRYLEESNLEEDFPDFQEDSSSSSDETEG
jgi:hypothetical protein